MSDVSQRADPPHARPATRNDVGASFGKGAVFALATALIIVVAGTIAYLQGAEDPKQRVLRISTGSASGTYHAIGEALREALLKAGVAGRVELMTSAGSGENSDRIGTGAADLAFVQSDTQPEPQARLIAELYQEVLHVLVAPGRDVLGRHAPGSDVQHVRELAGRNVSLGPEGSGTRGVAERVCEQFGIVPASDQPLAMEDAGPALLKGELDAVFVLTAAPSKAIAGWCAQGARLLGLGAVDQPGNLAHAMQAIDPSLTPSILPRGIYGAAPVEPVQAIAVSALLIANRSLPDAVVQDVTRLLFQSRVQLAKAERIAPIFRRLRERYEPSQFLIPHHEGAIAYFEREEPPFLVEHAEATSLVVTLLAGGFSVLLGVGKWYARRRKNRIDAFYNEVRAATADIGSGLTEIRAARAALMSARQRAFDDLIDEKVEANESFTIFQDYVTHELDRLDVILDRSTA